MYKIIRSKRKTLSLEITADLQLLVRSPLHLSHREIQSFVESHRQWINRNIEKRKTMLANMPPALSREEIEYLKKRAGEYLPARVEYYSAIMSVAPTGVKITSAQKRLGSCSAAGGICFSYKVMQYDLDVIDYVVIHELAHLLRHDHSKAFYEIVEKYCPDYKDIERRIKW